MADLERIKRDISSIAGRPKSVRFEEIERIVNQLEKLNYKVGRRRLSDGWLFSVGGQIFSVVTHNRRQSQLKKYYVTEFINAMAELKLYEE